jgi:hypothetical protein
MASFNQTAISSKVLSGNAVAILFGTQVVGFGQSSNFGVDFGTETLYGIGSANPQEVQQLKNSITVNLEVFMLTAQGIQILGYPTDFSEVLSGNQFNISALDAQGNPIKTAVSATAGNVSISIPANQICTESISFMCTDILGVNGTSILNGVNATSSVALASTALGALSVPQP